MEEDHGLTLVEGPKSDYGCGRLDKLQSLTKEKNNSMALGDLLMGYSLLTNERLLAHSHR
jgi:hypothetical protein